jgi:hypothetical protein
MPLELTGKYAHIMMDEYKRGRRPRAYRHVGKIIISLKRGLYLTH